MAEKKDTETKAKSGKKRVRRKAPANTAKYPRHSLERALRIPKAILDQNAGKDCQDREAAGFVGVSYNGPFQSEIGSAKKYGLIESPESKVLRVSDLAKTILRPQSSSDELDGLRQAVLTAPDIKEVYSHYRGERIPDEQFFDNTLVDKYGIPRDKVGEFKEVFFSSLKKAKLVDETGGRMRILDASGKSKGSTGEVSEKIKKLGKEAHVSADDSCFVMMPFGGHLGTYYSAIYEPAIKKSGTTTGSSRRRYFWYW